jgi:acetyl-CoA/propionyl-CoA carboxylase, biotin carboxylase, biotin carboxyl carrier protein
MKKVLITNRGEIALRIIRACRDYGLHSVAVYADPDADALHTRAADTAYALPGNRPAETYLNIPVLLDIARRAGADAVHPGYGFLSESATFARAVQEAGLIWIGPDPEVIAQLGDKVAARRIAERVGAPLVPGTPGPVQNPAEIHAFARENGLPIAIKAAHGGGGRGMKVVRALDEIDALFASAVREAETAFGNGECYAERFLDRPRHVEVQVLADRHGRVVAVGTRDCSLQRRNQKLVEEAPAPFLTPAQEDRILRAAEAICAEAGYSGAGTVEFLLSGDGLISFLEVNTRLQVEHPVTEEVTGIDLVIEQFRIAEGKPLSLTSTPLPRGHAMEFRINAEDPGRGFLPTPGLITRFAPPSGPGVRLDSGVEGGSTVPGNYDSLMAKLIVTGPTRNVVLARARRALAEFAIEGVASVLPFHRAVVGAADFDGSADFAVHTRWIETDFAAPLEAALRVEAVERPVLRGLLEIDGARHDIGIGPALLARLADHLLAGHSGAVTGAAVPHAAAPDAVSEAGVSAPIAGVLQSWSVEDGATVTAGQVVAVMEAMKMETQVTTGRAGRLAIQVKAGESVSAGTPLAQILE